MSENNYPLHWPESRTRTKHPAKSQFKATLSKALNNVEKSIAFFAKDSKEKVFDVVISSNVTLGQFNPDDAGVAIYFEWSGIETCIAVDLYQKVEENLQAIHHCIEAERTKLRHGGIELVKAAFRGYVALPPPVKGLKGRRNWWEVLNVARGASQTEVRARYKRLMNTYHPDKPTGNREKYDEVQQAWDEVKNNQ